jgi:Protein of unknown function (DUF2958)
MKERDPGEHPNQAGTDPEREQRRQQELLDGTNLLPEILKERMPALYSQEHERDPMVVAKYFDPVGSWTWYATEGSPVDEDGYYDKPAQKLQTSMAHAWLSTSVKPSRAAFLRIAAISRARIRWLYSSGLRSRNAVRWVSR